MYIYIYICLYIYVYIYIKESGFVIEGVNDAQISQVGLYKIVLYFLAVVHESIILLFTPPTCIARTIAIFLHTYCAIYDAPPPPSFVCHTP